MMLVKQRYLQIKIAIKTPKELTEDTASINFFKVVYYEKQKEPLKSKVLIDVKKLIGWN